MMRFKNIIILVTYLLVASCTPAPCEGPFPDYIYKPGEMAYHRPTGENVRIISKWRTWAGDCEQRRFGEYTIRFSDGAEITAVWGELKPLV